MVFSYQLIFDSLSFLVSSGILQLVSVLLAITAFFYQQIKEKKNKKMELHERLSRISNLILLDFEKLKLRLSGSSGYIVQTIDGNYIEDHISTDHYRSIVNSGLITYFQRETQFQVTHLYHYITLHNKRLFDMANMVNTKLNSAKCTEADRNDLETSIAWKDNQKELVNYDNAIREMLPTIKKLLESELQMLK